MPVLVWAAIALLCAGACVFLVGSSLTRRPSPPSIWRHLRHVQRG